MFLFGHVGLTWGGALLLVRASRRLARSAPVAEAAAQRPPDAGIDYRFVILGSILPDLIDKPLGLFILRKQISNGRTFAHSLLFASLIGLTSLARPGKGRLRLAANGGSLRSVTGGVTAGAGPELGSGRLILSAAPVVVNGSLKIIS